MRLKKDDEEKGPSWSVLSAEANSTLVVMAKTPSGRERERFKSQQILPHRGW